MNIDPEQLAQRFHETYERLAPTFGYETRPASAKPWSDVPRQNRDLMVAVCREIVADAPIVVRDPITAYTAAEECAAALRLAETSGTPAEHLDRADAWRRLADTIRTSPNLFLPPEPEKEDTGRR